MAVICASGFRSSIATSILEQLGFVRVTNVVGGTSAWRNAALDQDFALVVYNAVTTPSFEVNLNQATYVTGDTLTATDFRLKIRVRAR